MAFTTNMIRFHGVFAPNAKLRPEVVPKKPSAHGLAPRAPPPLGRGLLGQLRFSF
jgi:hypothetical protein